MYSTRIRAIVRQQWAGLIALFLVIAGGSALAATLPKNSANSKTLKDNSVKSKDLKNGKAVAGADVVAEEVQLRVGESCPEGQAIRVINVEGGVACEVDDQGGGGDGPPSGPAGGDLTGSYPNPLIGPDAVGSAEIGADAVGSAEIGADAVGSAEIGPGAVGTAEIGNGAVTSGKFFSSISDINLSVGPVAGESCVTAFDVGVTALTFQDFVVVTPPDGFPPTLTLTGVPDPVNDRVFFQICNHFPGGGSVDPPNGFYGVLVIRASP